MVACDAMLLLVFPDTPTHLPTHTHMNTPIPNATPLPTPPHPSPSLSPLLSGRTEHQLLSTADADSLTITLTALSALQHRLPSDAVDAVGSCLVDHCGSLGPQKWADVGIALSDQGYKDPLSGTLLPSIAHSVLERGIDKGDVCVCARARVCVCVLQRSMDGC